MKHTNRTWAPSPLIFVVMGFFPSCPIIAADGAPTVAKDSVQATAYTYSKYQKNLDTWSWVPTLQFRVNGPLESGSQLYAEFSLPTGGPWVKFDCKTGITQKDQVWKTECGARDVSEEKSSLHTGNVNFAIHVRNELANSDSTLFTGQFKIAKVHSNEHGPKVANHFVYYVDNDWNLPIAYLFLTPGPVVEWKRPQFNVAFWYRGDPGLFVPHMFYQGKEVGHIFYGDLEAGRPGCSADIQNGTTQIVDSSLPQKARWSRTVCQFYNILGWDKTGKTVTNPGQSGSAHLLSANPGEYEIKVLWRDHLARSIKFTVGADGKFDNSIAAENQLGSNRVIVPVQIIGDQDGNWDRSAWKTEAFYGNPLKGFIPAP